MLVQSFVEALAHKERVMRLRQDLKCERELACLTLHLLQRLPQNMHKLLDVEREYVRYGRCLRLISHLTLFLVFDGFRARRIQHQIIIELIVIVLLH